MGIESRGAGEIYTGNCVAVICLFLWLILYGREINFPSVLVETGRKYAFLIYLLHPAMSDLLKKCAEGLGVSNCQIYFWLRPVLAYLRSLRMQGKIFCRIIMYSQGMKIRNEFWLRY